MYRANMLGTVLTADQVKTLLVGRPTTHYAPSQILFYRKHLPAGLWVLLVGEVALRADGRIVAYVAGPALLGLHEILGATPYPVTAQAMTACEVAFLGKDEVQPYLQCQPLADMIAGLSHHPLNTFGSNDKIMTSRKGPHT